ncbi:hypothetical protein A3K86_03035 [Photobacterium jeanii]|uniref:Uncharacterized protein n=1 Tax=Photobacterium jeanii TaxID=858640 RepID=A0A178KKW9_9GAMM|nr:hypothetical protein [Photobacterium jeanii]OAN17907.1 hypothetical protein A3K86_03035 [Photobacterium jeanii]PST92426.1 hypothetical protein C9I91_04430 [Photobacterium jeanii]
MAAQKLTKGRLAQIIILMAVLITAFVWRTITYKQGSPENKTVLTCQLSTKSCAVNGQNINLPIAFVSTELKSDTPLQIQIGNTNVKPSAVVEGVKMYMGSIPVIFSENEAGWLGEFSVPACTHDEMEWALKLTQGEGVVHATFVVKK